MSTINSCTKKGSTKLSQFIKLIDMNHLKNIIILFLPIEDILKIKSLYTNSIQIHSLLHSPDQNQILFRFTRDMERVCTRPQISQLKITLKDCDNICTKLGKMQLRLSKLSSLITTRGLKASTRDDVSQDIDRTLDGIAGTWWSSDGSDCKEKIDWLLYDLGTVAVITRISIAAFKATFHFNSPIYGFQKCWIELGFDPEEFHYKTKEFICMNTDELQDFTTHEHLDNIVPAARYIKFWMQGCHQKQRIDDRWYFAINDFQVEGIPMKCFPQPVPQISEVAGIFTSSTEESGNNEHQPTATVHFERE